MSFFENTRKPTGLGSKLMVTMMNIGHRALAHWGLQFLSIAPDAKVLDCGCGAGLVLDLAYERGFEGSGVDLSEVRDE